MVPLLSTLLLLQSESPGRGGDLDGGGGILLVVGIALLAVLIAAGAGLLVMRGYRRRREAEASGETVRRPTASEQGRPFSSER